MGHGHRTWLLGGLVIVLVAIGVGWGLLRPAEVPDPAGGTTSPSGAGAAASAEGAVSVHERAPYEGDGYVVVVDPVLDDSVWMTLTAADGDVAQDVVVSVDQTIEAAGCAVTLLETRPGESGGDRGWALMRIECEPGSADTDEG